MSFIVTMLCLIPIELLVYKLAHSRLVIIISGIKSQFLRCQQVILPVMLHF